MFDKLPSLRGFQPKFYSGGPARFHLPLLYDLVAEAKPKRVVSVGFGDGQAFFAFCQAANEQKVNCECVAVRRDRAGESEEDDTTWTQGRDYGEEFYGMRVRLFSNSSSALAEVADGSVDILLLDDSDSGKEIREDLGEWESKLAPNATVLVHGLGLERQDGVKAVWDQWVAGRSHAIYPDGLGLGIAQQNTTAPSSFLLNAAEFTEVYALAAARIDASARAATAEKVTSAFETRQVWLDSLLTDRRKVQEIMDHQAHTIADLEEKFRRVLEDRAKAQLVIESLKEQVEHFDNLRRDRAKAQLIMDSQHEQLKQWLADNDRLKAKIETLQTQLKEHKTILKAAKSACRKKGRCFQIDTAPKVRRPFAEKIARELRRLPRNLGIARKTEAVPAPQEKESVAASRRPANRYETWIEAHEPDAAALKKQRQLSREFPAPAKISLLTPVHNPPAAFLEKMFASVLAQTYPYWELCIVTADSNRPETIEALGRWQSRDERIRVERLAENLGIAENTNRALRLATGDFVACLDHDDVLAPFALYELARAANEFPEADILYSDEDRLSAEGKRHAPFFKPEWDPELLCASMYIGHLSAYRRFLALELDGFRKEFDLSQDYDFALRATERARAIHHVPHVLYHWREHPASGSTGGKPGARRTNLAALAEAMRRRNLPAEIVEYPTANRARLRIERWPRVSIIVPTDSPTRAQACLQELPRATKYPDLEIVLVTNSQLADSLKFLEAQNATIRLVPYDKPFNFSDKCNAGAEAATGARLIFFNDDVETDQEDWIQNLIEPLQNPEIGAVAPKLLYETGKIQHAGLVMGVRGLAGTAFHQRPADSTEHFNLAQSMRDVAALSAACLAMRRDDFLSVGGFDAVNTPIAHSDIDLSFKVREAGLRCVYTPYATLRHAGHASIGIEEIQTPTEKRPRDKASIFLLKRWAGYATHDPYFPDNMRDWLHIDSPAPIHMSGRNEPNAVSETSADLLFVSHDLSLSGAPMMLFHAAAWCRRHGMFVAVMAPEDGPLRAKYEAEGIPLIVDSLVETEHESFAAFARHFDCVVANTIRTSAVVRALKNEEVPVVWWLHEPGSVGEHYLREEAKLRAAMPLADLLLAPSEQTASVYRPYTESPIRCLQNAIPDLDGQPPADGAPSALRFLLLASVEPRKGQDVFVKALAQLPKEIQKLAQFEIAGRILDPDFWPTIDSIAKQIENLTVTGALSHAEAIGKLTAADVIVSPSRDEAMPTVTILEAMSLRRAIIASNVGGAAETFTDGENALLVRPESPDELAAAIRRLIEKPALARELGRKARRSYEEGFTIERFGAEFSDLIMETISAAKSR
jgi:GT2 family glycosyltransferase/glycosyltransferase involved in cell wall biosynthesis/cell division protein FtsB